MWWIYRHAYNSTKKRLSIQSTNKLQNTYYQTVEIGHFLKGILQEIMSIFNHE